MASDEEDKYFEAKQSEWRSDVRREKRLEAIREGEREGVARELDTSEAVAEEALQLGFDQETARVLPLVPLVQMAWADGKVTGAEGSRVRTLAKNFGIDPESEAFEFLQLMLQEQPSEVFFERVSRVLVHMVEDNPETWNYETLVDLLEDVAEASGGFFGLTNPVNDEEREVLHDFAELLSVEGKQAEDVLPDNDE